ncbi:MAG: hypothetical protein JST73_12115 [Actinobacteria bacterium]|nr:hypothetical protein [Actinomycetota bacterium]
MPNRLIFVEDSLARATEIRRLLDLYRSGAAIRDGRNVPRLVIAGEEFWDPDTALARITGGAGPDGPPGPGADTWDPSGRLFMDCWDRDAMDPEVSNARSTFFALDLLRGLRNLREHGRAVPRVVVHSRGMRDDLLRAALAEFTTGRRQFRVPDATPVVRWRLETPVDPSKSVIWAMFDRSALERDLDLILAGDRSSAMTSPRPDSPVWDQIRPTSCLASFHCALRDECPDVWEEFVIGRASGEPGARSNRPLKSSLNAAAVARVTRIANRYLELDDSWGARGYRGYLAIARALANPEY